MKHYGKKLTRIMAVLLALVMVVGLLPNNYARATELDAEPEDDEEVRLMKTADWIDADWTDDGIPRAEVTLSVNGDELDVKSDIVVLLDRSGYMSTLWCICQRHYREVWTVKEEAIYYYRVQDDLNWYPMKSRLIVRLLVHDDGISTPVLAGLYIEGYETEGIAGKPITAYSANENGGNEWSVVDWAEVEDAAYPNSTPRENLRDYILDKLLVDEQFIKDDYTYWKTQFAKSYIIKPTRNFVNGCQTPFLLGLEASTELAKSVLPDPNNKIALMTFSPGRLDEPINSHTSMLAKFGDTSSDWVDMWEGINPLTFQPDGVGHNDYTIALLAAKYYLWSTGYYNLINPATSAPEPFTYPNEYFNSNAFNTALEDESSALWKLLNGGKLVSKAEEHHIPYIVIFSSVIPVSGLIPPKPSHVTNGYTVDTTGIEVHGIGFAANSHTEYNDNLKNLTEGYKTDDKEEEQPDVFPGHNYPPNTSSYNAYKGSYSTIADGTEFTHAFEDLQKNLHAYRFYDALITDRIGNGFVMDQSRLPLPYNAKYTYDNDPDSASYNTITWELGSITDTGSTFTYYIKAVPTIPTDPTDPLALSPLNPDDVMDKGTPAPYMWPNKFAKIKYKDYEDILDDPTKEYDEDFPDPILDVEEVIYTVEYYQNNVRVDDDTETRVGYTTPLSHKIPFDDSLVQEDKYYPDYLYDEDSSDQTPSEVDIADTVKTFKLYYRSALPSNLQKIAINGDTFVEDKEITYELSFDMPNDVSELFSVRVCDDIPTGLTFMSATIQIGISGPDTATVDVSKPGEVSYIFTGTDLNNAEDQHVVFTIVFGIDIDALPDDFIVNNGTLYYTPDITDPPEIPCDYDESLVVILYKTANPAMFDGVGDEIDYEISFTLPTATQFDLSVYDAIRIEDEELNTLNIVGTTGDLIIDGDLVGPVTLDVDLDGDFSYTLTADGLTELFDENVPDLSVLAGKTITLALKFKVNDNWVRGRIRNTANLYFKPVGANNFEPGESAVATVYPHEGFKKVAEVGAALVQDENISFELSFEMPDDVDRFSNVRICDYIPSGLEFQSATIKIDVDAATDVTDDVDLDTPGEASYNITGTMLTYAEGKMVVFTIVFKVNTLPSNGYIINKGKLFYTPAGGGTDIPDGEDEAIVVIVDKSANPGEFTDVGDKIDYTIGFALPNDLSDYEAIRIEDVIPDTLSLVGTTGELKIGTAASETVTLVIDSVTGAVSYELKDQQLSAAAGKTITLKLTFEVNNNWQSGPITNTANLYFTPKGGAEEPGGSADATIYPPVTFQKRALNGKTFVQDEQIEYELSFKMPYNIDRFSKVQVFDDIPAGLSFKSATIEIDGGSANDVTTLVDLTTVPGEVSYSFTGAALQAADGKMVVFKIVFDVETLPPNGYIVNKGTLKYTLANGSPGDTLEDEALVVLVDKIANPDQFSGIGDEIDYKISFALPLASEFDLSAYDAILIEDVIPDTLSLVGIEGEEGTLTIDWGRIEGPANLGIVSLSPDADGNIRYTITAEGLEELFDQPMTDLSVLAGARIYLDLTLKVTNKWQGGPITNTANIYFKPAGSDVFDPGGSDDATIFPLIPLQKIAEDGATLIEGGDISYDLSFEMPDDVSVYSSIRICDNIPTGLSFQSATIEIDGGSAVDVTSLVDLSKPGEVSYILTGAELTSAADKIVVFTIVFRIDNMPSSGFIVNKGTLYYTPVDEDEETGGEDEAIVVLVYKTADPKTFTDIGDEIDYDIGFTLPTANQFDLSAYDAILIEDVIPDTLGLVGTTGDLIIDGTLVGSVTLDVDADGDVSYTLTAVGLTDLLDQNVSDMSILAGKTIILSLKFKITDKWQSGPINNTANIYFKPADSGIFEPGGSADATIYPPVTFQKKALNGSTFVKDEQIEYELSFMMPYNINRFSKVKISDDIPAGLSFSSATIQVGSGTPDNVTALVDLSTAGEVSYSFTGTALQDAEAQMVVFKIVFDVVTLPSSGYIVNKGKLTYTYAGSGQDETYDDEAIVVLVDKTADPKEFTTIGDVIDYEISFKLPGNDEFDLSVYEAIRIEDVIPNTLSLVGATGELDIGMPSTYTVTLDDGTPGKVSYTLTNAALSALLNPTTMLDLSELAGKTITLMLQFEVTNNWVNGPITNTANIYFKPTDTDAFEPAGSDDETIYPLIPLLKMAKDGAALIVGEDISYTLSFEVPNDVSLYDSIRICDDIPTGLTFQSAAIEIGGAGPDSVTGKVDRSISGEVSYILTGTELENAAGETVVFTIVFRIDQLPNSGILVNNGTLFYTPVDEDEETSGEDDAIVILVDKIADPKKFTDIDDVIDYTISFTLPADDQYNISAFDALRIEDVIPDTLSLVGTTGNLTIDGSAPLTVTLDIDADGISYTLFAASYLEEQDLSRLAGSTITLTLQCKVNNNWTSGSITNTANIYFRPVDSGVFKPGGSADEIIYPPVPFQKTVVNGAAFVKDGVISYKLSFDMPDDVSDYSKVRICDDIPDGLTFLSATIEIGSGATVNVTTLVDLDTSGEISYILEGTELEDAEGKLVVFTLVFGIDELPDSGYIVNKGTLYYTPATGGPDIPGGEDEAIVVLVDKTADPGKFTANGDEIKYTISFKLPGIDEFDFSAYDAILIEDVIPDTLGLVGTSPYTGNLITDGGSSWVVTLDIDDDGNVSYTLTADNLDIPDLSYLAGATISLELDFEVQDWVSGPINNTAYIYFRPANSNEFEPGGSDDETIYPPVPFQKKALEGAALVQGEDVSYALSFEMPDDVNIYSKVRICDDIPAGLTFKSATIRIGSGAAVSVTGLVDTHISGEISYIFEGAALTAAEGEIVVFTIVFRVDQLPESGYILNKGTLYYTPIDGEEETGGEDESIVVVVDKTADPGKFTQIGDVIEYTINFAMPGVNGYNFMDHYNAIRIEDRFPDTLELVEPKGELRIGSSTYPVDLEIAATLNGSFVAAAYTIEEDYMLEEALGNDISLTILFKISDNWESGSITNTANISFRPVDSNIFDPGGSDDETIYPPAEFQKRAANGSAVVQGGDIIYELSFEMPEDVDRFKNVRICDDIPEELAYKSATIKIGGGAEIDVTELVDLTKPGEVSYNLKGTELKDAEGKMIVFTIVFEIVTYPESGYIVNEGTLYFTPADDDFEELGGEDESIVIMVEKTATPGKFTSNGDLIDYKITFSLPEDFDLERYSAIRIEDILPATLGLVGTTGELQIGNAPPVQVTLDTSTAGKVIYIVTADNLAYVTDDNTISLTLVCKVQNWTKLSIKNTANLYLISANGKVEPGGTADAVIYPVADFLKRALEGSTIVQGGQISYELSFDMPEDVDRFSRVRIYDDIPDGLSFQSASIKVGSGAAVNVTSFVDLSKPGEVSYNITGTALAEAEAETVVFTITFRIDTVPEIGYIVNKGALYYTPVDGEEEPGGEDESIVVLVIKTANPKTFTSNGDEIDYTISFALPPDMSDYDWVRIEDMFPETLSLVNTVGELKIGTATSLQVSLDTNGTPGKVSYSLMGERLKDAAGNTVSLTLRFKVDGWVSGPIVNTANLYLAPMGRGEKPGGSAKETITQYSPGGNGGNGGGGTDIIDPGTPGGPSPFIEDHVAYIIGYPEGDVRPQRDITRAEVATVFFRLLTDDLRSQNWIQTNPFPDVVMSNWFNNAVSVMNNMGIVLGYPDGTFKPNGSITRAELATIAARFARMMATVQTSDRDFSDIAGHWAEDDIMYAAAIGWVNGYPDGTFRPNQPITRAEFMTLVNRMLQRVPESNEDLLSSVMVKWVDNADDSAWYYLAVQEATNSHVPEYKAGKLVPEMSFEYERWTAMADNRDWAQLEKSWSTATSATR